MIVKEILESHELKRDTDGFSEERSFFISQASGNPQQKLYNAMTLGGIPQYGDPHPFLPEVTVTEVMVTPVNSGDLKVKVSYSVPTVDEIAEAEAEEEAGSGTVIVTSNTATESVFQDVKGELLKAQYGLIATKYATADVETPQLSVDFNRTELSIPKGNIAKFLGTINSVPWSGYPAKTWLCNGIEARQNKGKFDVEYSFVYRPKTWELEVVVGLTEAEAQELPIDVDSGNGYARYDVYNQTDFNQLGLSF